MSVREFGDGGKIGGGGGQGRRIRGGGSGVVRGGMGGRKTKVEGEGRGDRRIKERIGRVRRKVEL